MDRTGKQGTDGGGDNRPSESGSLNPGQDQGESWLGQVFDKAPCIVFVVDDDGRILLSNQKANEMVGCPDGGLAGGDFLGFLDKQVAGRPDRDQCLEAIRGTRKEPLEQGIRARDGQLVLTRFTFVRVPSPDGHGEVTLCVGEDMTRVRSREAELRESERQARDAFRLLAAFSRISGRILHESNLDEVCMLFVEAIREHSIYSRAILTLIDEQGKGYLWYFTGLSDDEIEEFHRNKLTDAQRGSIFQDRFRLGNSYYIPHDSGWQYQGVRSRAEQGQRGPAQWHPDDFLFIPLYGTNRGLIGMVSVDDPADRAVPTPESLSPLELFANQVAHCIEKTRLDRKVRDSLQKLEMAKEQLVQAEKLSAIGELVSGVAHELNNPLTGVMGYAQLLMGSGSDPKTNKNLEKIHHEATRCQKIVQNLLMFARRHKAERHYQSVNDILKSTLELREYQLRVDNIRVRLQLDEGLPKTMVDFFQLQQVFLNLINNAHQAMVDAHGKGELTVSTWAEDDQIHVVIDDSGPGIQKENLSKIFDPFFTTKEVGKGTGLGLSLSYGIVKEHGGTINVKSESGRGTAISIVLPIQERKEAAAEETPRIVAPDNGGGRSILVVDDEEVIVSLLEEILTTEGHRVDVARNGLEALHKIRTGSYDLVLSDLRMPGMGGEDLYSRIGKEQPELLPRIVFTTGDIVSPDVQKFIKRTGNRFITKPFSLEDVLQTLHHMEEGDQPSGS
jgi:signal transduction histidine kinase/CheY-like chemotaxis protein